MTLVKSSLSLAALLSVFAMAGAATSAQAQDGRYMSRCAMQCASALSDSCLQRCESEHETKKKKIKIVKIPPPKDDPVPKIVFNPGVDGGGNGGGGGRGK